MSAAPQFDPVRKLSRDLRNAAKLLSPAEVRFLVDDYYAMQENRKRSSNQMLSMEQSGEPHEAIIELDVATRQLEANIKAMLDSYSADQPLGQWARSVCGIGPVIAAGLLAHIDIQKAPTAGHIWRFAGLDPTVEWQMGKKRPWNASLKTLCWKIGESFVKVSGLEQDVYGKVWLARKELEIRRNDEGLFAEQARIKLEKFKIGKEKEARKSYEAGRLPAGHLHARAKRYAVKLFLAHYHHVAFWLAFGTAPPLPYPIAHMEHAHVIPPPNWPHIVPAKHEPSTESGPD
jgi:hypothetical protein